MSTLLPPRTRSHPAPLVLLFAVVTLGLALVAAVPGGGQSAAAASEQNTSEQDAEEQEPGSDDGDPDRPVVLIGVSGLAWEDISERTPAMQSLTEETVASLIVRSVRSSTCPASGWLAISAGNRAGDEPGRCRTLTDPQPGEQVPGWEDYLASAEELNYRAQPGLFATLLAEDDVTTAAIGPGAAIALADPDGQVENYQSRGMPGVGLTTQALSAVREAQLTVIDAGALRPVPRPAQAQHTEEAEALRNPISDERFRADQLELIERRVAAILGGIEQLETEPVVILAGVADDGDSGLRVLAITGGATEPGLGISSSSRQEGYVMATDLLPTLLALLDLPPVTDSGAIGATMRVEPTDMDAAERREFLEGQDIRAQAVRPIVPTYYLILVGLNLGLFAALAIGLKRPAAERFRQLLARRFPSWSGRLSNFTTHRGRVLRGMRVAALAIASLPVASYLANLLPWWRNTPAALGLAVYIALIVAVIVAVALAGPWRRHMLGPATVVAGITALVLTVDIATGARLQLSSVMGVSTLVAGRMYGMNNTAFTLYTVSMLMVTITLANYLVLRNRRRLAAALTMLIGIGAAIFDGAPGLGADFGGPPAILPAFGVLALLAAGIRLTWLRVGLVLVISASATVLIAFLDWLRPVEDHTHLGRFFQTVLDGGLLDVIARNLGQNVSLLFGNTPMTLLALAGVLTVVFVLARPIRLVITEPGTKDSLTGGTPISKMGQEAPMLPPGIIALGIALGIGMAVNDSGIAIPANGVAVGVPLLVAACTTWMLSLGGRDGEVRVVPGPNSAGEAPSGLSDDHEEQPQGRLSLGTNDPRR
ncbi:MAG TPA: hypothetical protein VK095_08600 [Beutenbergiaceae bacterium]|nr:hypothetical protein [Beutenbergiaceae bacterium]